jgi:hypothetical protein
LRHFIKQDLELLRVAGDDIFLGLKLSQRNSEPYTKLEYQPVASGVDAVMSYGALQYRWLDTYSTFGRKTGRTTSSVSK